MAQNTVRLDEGDEEESEVTHEAQDMDGRRGGEGTRGLIFLFDIRVFMRE